MSEQRRPTTKLGRAKQRDPRVDSVPPSARGKDTNSRRPEPLALDGVVSGATGGDIDELLGRLLARATQAEVHAQHLEQTLARLNEERVVLEARMAELVRQLDDADTHRASLEAQVKTVSQSRRTDGPVTLAYVRSMAAELVRALDRVGSRSSPSEVGSHFPASGAPTPRPPSDLPTPRSRSDRPRR
jgi:phage shock protein A